MVGVSFVNLVIFPEFLPLGFSGKGVVETGEIGNGCGHAGKLRKDSNKFCHRVGEGLMETNRRGAEGAERLREDNAFDAVFEEGDIKVDEKG